MTNEEKALELSGMNPMYMDPKKRMKYKCSFGNLAPEVEVYETCLKMAEWKDDYYKNILDDNDKRMRRIADCNIAYSKLYCDANEESVYMAQKLGCAWKLFERHATYKDPSTGETICIMTKDQFMDQIKELWEKDSF